MSKTIKYRLGGAQFQSDGFTGVVDIDDMTSIHYDNIEGELLTVTTNLNKMGMLRALAEKEAKRSKLSLEIFSAGFMKDIRVEANLNSNHFIIDGDRVKLTEHSIKEALRLNKGYKEKNDKLIEDETNFEMSHSIYWTLKEKSDMLKKLIYTLSSEKE